jgi:hypothetical protein
MLTVQELVLVAARSNSWTGPNCWGICDGFRLDLDEVLQRPEFG